MSEIRFYHLTKKSSEQALPDLLLKALASGKKIVVRTQAQSECDRLDKVLWSYDEHSFLPHGTKDSGYAESQPIYLTCQSENPNGAAVMISLGPVAEADLIGFELVCILFDGRSQAQTQEARLLWSELKSLNYNLAYWQQSESGAWEKK